MRERGRRVSLRDASIPSCSLGQSAHPRQRRSKRPPQQRDSAGERRRRGCREQSTTCEERSKHGSALRLCSSAAKIFAARPPLHGALAVARVLTNQRWSNAQRRESDARGGDRLLVRGARDALDCSSQSGRMQRVTDSSTRSVSYALWNQLNLYQAGHSDASLDRISDPLRARRASHTAPGRPHMARCVCVLVLQSTESRFTALGRLAVGQPAPSSRAPLFSAAERSRRPPDRSCVHAWLLSRPLLRGASQTFVLHAPLLDHAH